MYGIPLLHLPLDKIHARGAGRIEAFLPHRKIKTGATSPIIGVPQTLIEVETGARTDDLIIGS
jgi:hypothetical protein